MTKGTRTRHRLDDDQVTSQGNHFHRLNTIVHSPAFARLPLIELRVLIVLLRFSDFETGEAWPSVKTMADLVGCPSKPSRVRHALKTLRRRGFIEVVVHGGGRGKSTKYRVLAPNSGMKTTSEKAHVSNEAKGGSLGAKRGSHGRKKEGKSGEKTGAKHPPPNTTQEQLKKHHK